MVKAGNMLHFELGSCYVQHVASGRATPIEEKAGTYELRVWIPRAKKGTSRQEYGGKASAGFARQEVNAQ